jgi:hypothetical protein
MPVLVLGFVCMDVSSSAFSSVLATTLRIYFLEVNLVNVPVPVWVQYITGTGIPFNASTGKWCQYQYWHICTFVQYQYWHGTLPVLALIGASTSIGIYAFWSSTSIGTVHYRNWHLMVPVLVTAFMHFGPLPVLARYTTGTGIKWCQYRYRHICFV